MTPSFASSRGKSGAPWEREAPALEALECGEAELEDIGWHHTLLFIEDLWATAAASNEPDVKDLSVRVRPLLRRLAGHVRDGYSRLFLDDLQRAAVFLESPLRSILDRPNTRLARAHEYVPWERVEELDARSLLWMSRLPGRTTREKSASTRRALGVVRKHSLEVAENRVLVRLAMDLLPLLERRLETISGLQTCGAQTRQQDLLSLRKVLRDDLPASPLASVRPAFQLDPNNALLGAGSYGRVWRAWRWLELRQERFAELWRCGLQLVHRALGLLVAARLAERRDALLIDNLATLRLGGAEFGLGLLEPMSFNIVLASENPRCVSIRSATGSLQIVTLNALTRNEAATLDVALSLDSSRTQSGRGCPVRAAWIDVDREVLGDVEGWFDAENVEAITTALVAALDLGDEATLPRIVVAGADVADRAHDVRDAQFVAVDLAAAEPVIASERGVARGSCCVAIDVRAGDEHLQRIVGNDALAMDAGLADASFFLSASWDAIASGECDVASLANALSDLVGGDSNPDRELCIPVADGLGEPGEALLRAALLAHARHTWLVPRAAAAALALRADDPEAVGVDDHLLVFDCGPLGFEGRLVALRSAADSNESDPYFWECPLPWPTCSESRAGATGTFWRGLIHACVASGTPQEYIDRVADSGLAGRVATDSEGRPGACSFGNGGQLGPLARITGSAIDAAALEYAEHFRKWLDALAREGAFSAARIGGHERLHVLVVGEPLALPQIASALRAQCAAALGEAILHVPATAATVARGGVEFLRRNRAGSLTFELALPDLYLKSIDASGRAASRPIFQRQSVRPGQVVPVDPIPFELPARVPRIELPLEREPGGRRPLAFRAVLDGEGFPLRVPLRVDLLVEYRYAEDGFRLRIRPRRLDETTAVLAEREVRWLRSDARVDDRALNNEPPGFPSPIEPSVAATEGALAAVSRFREKSEEVLGSADRRQGAGVRDFVRYMEEVSRGVAALHVSDPSRQLDPSVVSRLAEAWVVPLCLLVDCSPDPFPKRPAPRWAPKANEIRKQLPSLREAALASISRLRGSSPVGVPKILLSDAERLAKQGKDIDDKHWMSLGRTVNALAIAARGPAMRRIVQLLCARAVGAAGEFGAWWAVATALWSETELVLDLNLDTVESLVARIEVTLQNAKSLHLNLFHELGIVLMALLRRRGRTDAGPVDAGTQRLRRLADQFEETERRFVTNGKPREPRLKIVSQNEQRVDVSMFVDSLAAALRGERVALIRMLED